MREVRHSASINQQQMQIHQRCDCSPLSPLQNQPSTSRAQTALEQSSLLPVTMALNDMLLAALPAYFPRATPFSMLLMHIVQYEHLPIPPDAAVVHQRSGYHASAELLEQVLGTVRGTLRADDPVLQDTAGAGAIMLFPDVEQEGIARILERVSRSINLLQAETIVPPLRYETRIALGAGSYPYPAQTLEELLLEASQRQESITFRPAMLPHAASFPIPASRSTVGSRSSRARATRGRQARFDNIPFMQLPTHLPTRLRQLIPYSLALELRCAPVGCDHNRLTVVMANPTDAHAILQLRETTGMTIFPVTCEPRALETLLASGW